MATGRSKKINVLFNVLKDIPLILYYFIENIVLFFIPKRLQVKDITGETVLITGAGSGIGRELACRFADCGTKLILLDINLKGLNETREIIVKTSKSYIDVFVYECDVSNRYSVYDIAKRIEDEVGTVNILVNNAGVVTGKSLLECPDDMIQKTMDVNIMAHFWTCKAFLPNMRKENHGHIVTISSMAAFVAVPKLVDYCTSKSAAAAFDENLKIELEQEGYTGIKTTLVALGFVTTGLFQGFNSGIQNPLNPTEVAKRIVSGVLCNKEVVVMPTWFNIFFPIKGILPRKSVRQLNKSIYLTKSMDNFQGRTKIN